MLAVCFPGVACGGRTGLNDVTTASGGVETGGASAANDSTSSGGDQMSSGGARARRVAVSVASNGYAACAVLDSGNLTCWGSFDVDTSAGGKVHKVPIDVLGISSVQAISMSYNFACVVSNGGHVRCWGANDEGQLGDGTTSNSSVPVEVVGITDAVTVSAGSTHACAVLASGKVNCWGNNGTGELGNESTETSHVPVTVTGISTATEVAAGGFFTCAVMREGAVQCWGDNGIGEMGVATEVVPRSSTPVEVASLSRVTNISAASTDACAVDQSGLTWCWGHDLTGIRSTNGSPNYWEPSTVSGLSDALAVAVNDSSHYACAVQRSGAVACWGDVIFAALDRLQQIPLPLQVPGISDCIAIAPGFAFSCFLLRGGRVQCMGSNDYGQLGDGSTTSSNVPVTVSGF